MAWHILRKDWKLLWRMVLGVALIHAIERAILSAMGPLAADRASPLAELSTMLGIVSLLATAVLIVMVVQQDAPSGQTQDWLVRPIRRRDLLLGKVLFVVLLVQGPICAAEVVQGLAAGFPLHLALAAPLSRSLWMLVALDLPVLAFASLTRSLAQAAGVGLAIVLGCFIFAAFAIVYFGFYSNWTIDSAKAGCGLVGASVVLALQYCQRKTVRASWAFGTATLAWLVLQFLPWNTALAIEEQLSPRAEVNRVQIVFEPTLGKLPGPSPVSGHSRGLPTNDVPLFVPLRKAGLGEGQILATAQAAAWLTEPSGAKVNLGAWRGSYFLLAAQNPARELVWVPGNVYSRLKDQRVGMEIDYSLTLLQANRSPAIPAPGRDQWIEGVGRCATRANAGDAPVELACLAPGDEPCVTFSMEHDGMSRQNVRSSGCRSDFAPFFARLEGDSITRFSLKDVRAPVTAYRPQAQFTRRVLIPDIRLSDWRAE